MSGKYMFWNLMALIVSMAVLAGSCKKQETSGNKQTTITWWIENWQEDQAKQCIQEFTAEHPNYKIEYTIFSYDTMDSQEMIGLQSSNPPDIVNVMLAWTPSFASRGLLEPLEEYIVRDQVDIKDFWQSAIDGASYKNKIYGLPYRDEAMGLYWNKDMFREAGLDPEKPPQTFQELREMALKLTKDTNSDGTIDQYGFGYCAGHRSELAYRLLPVIWSYGGDLLGPDLKSCALGGKEARDAVRFWTDLYVKDKVVPNGAITATAPDLRDLFLSKTIAIYVSGQWDVDSIKNDQPDIDFGTALQPGIRNDKPAPSVLGGWQASLAARGKQKDAAWEFVKYFTAKKVQEYYTITYPGRISAMSAARYQGEMLKPFAEAMGVACRAPAPVTVFPECQQVLQDVVQAIMTGRKSVDAAIDDGVKAINDLLNE
jgi:multiple sugar transport system substrate-binding protein